MNKERVYDYLEWRKKYCTVVLAPADLGVRVPPGVNHGVTLDVRVRARSWWSVPRVGLGKPADAARDDTRPYELQVLMVYDKYQLTLTNRGNAQLKLQNVPSLDLPQQVSSVDAADLRAQFA